MKDLRHVLVVSEPGKDGVFDYVRQLVRHLHAHHPGVTVDLAYSSRRAGDSLPAFVESIGAHGGEAVDLQIGNAPAPGDFLAARLILDLVRRRRPQVVHANSSKAGGLVRLLALKPGFPPTIYTPHAYYGVAGKHTPAVLVYNAIEAVLGHVGIATPCSTDEMRFARGTLYLPPSRLRLVNNGIDVARFRPPTVAEKAAARVEFGLPAEGTVLCSVGRDNPQKNYRALYAALDRLLPEARPPLWFVHAGAGAGDLGRTLSPAAQKRFLSFEYTGAIERLLRASDAFILTSRYEGLSFGMLQALATGLKMFLTRVPGNRCVDDYGFSGVGWIEPAKNTERQAALIETVLGPWMAAPAPGDPNQVTRARALFDGERQLEEMVQLYRERAAA
jgi:glycosyltransferase involved in cell wall biosynthesis